MVILLIFAVLVVVYLIWKREPKKQTINFFSGGLGSGKTFMITRIAVNAWRWSLVSRYLSFGLLKERHVYSNYPIRLTFLWKQKWSTQLTRSLMLGSERLAEKCIVVLDEASRMFPNQNKKSDEIVTFSFRWFRHFTNGMILMADQSIGDIDIAVRRRVNKVYNLSSFRKFLRFYLVDIEEIQYQEDLQNYVQVRDINDKFKKFAGIFPFRKQYASRYAKNWYIAEFSDTVLHSQYYFAANMENQPDQTA